MKIRQQNNRGLTLIEVVIVTTLLVILLGSVYGLMEGAFFLWGKSSKQIDIQQNGRTALEMMEMDIRRAQGISRYSTANSMYLTIDFQTHRYYASGTQIIKSVSGSGNNPVAYNVEQLTFVYHPNVTNCKLIEVLMVLKNEQQLFELRSRIHMRSSGF